jgi:chorismate mutase
MIYLTFLAAFLLSGIAAYYSIIGLAAIFTGAFWPVVIMGGALEFAKLVTASWLYRNWKTTPFLLRGYLTAAVVILMLITSMGIFGFLSKSHIDSTLDAGDNSTEIKMLNQKETITKDKLEYLLARAKDPSTASNKLDKQIQDTQKELSEINKQKLPLLKEENKLTAEVGPIKYVADIFYGDGDGALDKAVRLVIFFIMLVFDPLAVLLLIAGNITIKENKVVESVESEYKPGFIAQEVGEFLPEAVMVSKENLATYDYNDEFTFRERGKK